MITQSQVLCLIYLLLLLVAIVMAAPAGAEGHRQYVLFLCYCGSFDELIQFICTCGDICSDPDRNDFIRFPRS